MEFSSWMPAAARPGPRPGQPRGAEVFHRFDSPRAAAAGPTPPRTAAVEEFPRRWVARRPCDPPPTGRSMSTWPRVGVHRPLRRSRVNCARAVRRSRGCTHPNSWWCWHHHVAARLRDIAGRHRIQWVERGRELLVPKGLGQRGCRVPGAKCPSTVVPRPGAEMIRSSPPAARIRSRMPVSPWAERTARRVEPVPVVGDAEPQPAARPLVVGRLHGDDRAARVPVGVVDGLGAAEVDGRLDRGRVPAQRVHVDRARQDRAAGRGRQGPDQAPLAEQRWVDAVGQVAQLADRRLELALQAAARSCAPGAGPGRTSGWPGRGRRRSWRGAAGRRRAGRARSSGGPRRPRPRGGRATPRARGCARSSRVT